MSDQPNKYDFIIVLNPSVVDTDCKFTEFEKGQYLGGQTRMEAALKLSEVNKNTEFILVGGYDQNSSQSKKVDDMANFLKNRNEKINIIKRLSLPCSHHNFIAVFNEYYKDLIGKKVGLLTNFYHLPRSLMFYSEVVNKEEKFKVIPTLIPICAESLVDNSDVLSMRYIEYISRINSEIKGLGDNEKGKYFDNCMEANKKNFIKIAATYPEILLTEYERNIKYREDVLEQIKKETFN
ncbi:MAG: ElyC/SanA/YdcF family protein [Patescibacteria group bacterium]|jgi:hypothetical protein